jgi:hypothetical protein
MRDEARLVKDNYPKGTVHEVAWKHWATAVERVVRRAEHAAQQSNLPSDVAALVHNPRHRPVMAGDGLHVNTYEICLIAVGADEAARAYANQEGRDREFKAEFRAAQAAR